MTATSTTTPDSSGNGNTGTIYNSWTVGAPLASESLSGSFCDLDTTNRKIVMGPGSTFTSNIIFADNIQIPKATMYPEYIGRATFYLINNNAPDTWETVTSGSEHTFTIPGGMQLFWKASASTNTEITSVRVDYEV